MCGEFVEVPKGEDIKYHIREAHADEPDEVAENFEPEVAAVVQESSQDATAEAYCRLCGDPTDPDLLTHLYREHSNEVDAIGEEYDREISNKVYNIAEGNDVEPTEADSATAQTAAQSTTETASSSDSNTGSVGQSQQAPTGDREPNRNDRTEQAAQPAANTASEAGAGKWFVWGVGGAGNGILDSVLLRRETLDNISSPISGIWGAGGMRGYHMVNSNDAEVEKTFFIKTDQEWDDATVIERCIIGTGAGMGEDPVEANELANEHVMNRNWLNNTTIRPGDVNQAQATLFLQSLVKGTGTGMTPVLAEYLRQNENWAGEDKQMVSAAIVPNEAKEDSDKTIYGLGGLAEPFNSIILFSNDRLAGAPDELAAEIDYSMGPSGQKFGHKNENQTLIRFLEGLTMTSNMGVDISGEGYDVRDTFQPAVGFYPDHLDYTPAVVCAPVLASFTGGTVTEDTVDTLVFNALNNGRLVDFDPATAWGGSFLIAGPEHKMDAVRELHSDSRINKMIRNHSGVEESDGPGQFLRLRSNQAVLESADDLYMFGVMYNPELPHLQQMYDRAETMKEFPGKNPGALKERWDDVNMIFDHLGMNSLRES